jgi:hypothetical protein
MSTRWIPSASIIALTVSCLSVPAAGGDARVPFLRGDVDQNGRLDITDPIRIFGALFAGGQEPGCAEAADANDSGKVDISDGIYLLSFLFQGGPPPKAPFPDCGLDPLDTGTLSCASYAGCPLTVPLLFSLAQGDENLCPGQEITLNGVNFSPVLARDRVWFRASNSRIPGLPVFVEFPTDGDPRNGLESALKVIVPTGVMTGNVELYVDGVFSGAAGYFACPQILGVGIGPAASEPSILHSGLQEEPSDEPVIAFGINLDEVNEVLIGDREGTMLQKLPQSNLIPRPSLPDFPRNNLRAFGFQIS